MQSPYTLAQVGTPTVEPLTLLEAKAHLRVDVTAEDALIQAWIQAARQHVELHTGRAMLPQDWELRTAGFPAYGYIELPRPPLLTVLSVSTYSAAGVATVLDPSEYQIEAPSGDDCGPGRIYAAAGLPWPLVIAADVRGAVRIRYRAGYASPGLIPQPLRAAMLLIVGDLFENREGSNGRNQAVNPTVDRLLAPYRVLSL